MKWGREPLRIGKTRALVRSTSTSELFAVTSVIARKLFEDIKYMSASYIKINVHSKVASFLKSV